MSSNQANWCSYQGIVCSRCCTWNSKIFFPHLCLIVCFGKVSLIVQVSLWLLRSRWLWTSWLPFPSPYVMRLLVSIAVEIMWCLQTQDLNYSWRTLYWAEFWDEIIGLNVFSVRIGLYFPHPCTLFMFPFFSCGMESLFCDILYTNY